MMENPCRDSVIASLNSFKLIVGRPTPNMSVSHISSSVDFQYRAEMQQRTPCTFFLLKTLCQNLNTEKNSFSANRSSASMASCLDSSNSSSSSPSQYSSPSSSESPSNKLIS